MTDTTACPGCGVELPVTDWPLGRRLNASPACWHLQTEVMAHESAHLAELGDLHQFTVDTYGAQHAGVPSPPMSTAFALIGLHLALDEGWSGIEVRDAHHDLAGRYASWPAFTRPIDTWPLTVAHVAGALNPAEHRARVEAWGTSVWAAWSPEHAHVRAWAAEVLPSTARARLRAKSRPHP